MIIGFAITKAAGGSSTFGVIHSKNDNPHDAKKAIIKEAKVPEGDTVILMPAEEALSQMDGIAFLAPAEL